jgi:hypothetical protein
MRGGASAQINQMCVRYIEVRRAKALHRLQKGTQMQPQRAMACDGEGGGFEDLHRIVVKTA